MLTYRDFMGWELSWYSGCTESALELSDSVRCNERQSAIMMVRRCMADLKPGVFDAPLRGCGA